MTTPAALPAHSITRAQYRAAIAALGLDPDRVVSVTLAGTYATVTAIEVDDDGAPVVELGALVTTSLHGPLLED